MTTAEDVLNVARGQIGVTGDSRNDTAYSRWYGFPGQSWCDMFVSWVGEKAGAAGIIGHFAYCPSHVNWFKNRGQWGSVPRPGAVVFFDWDGDRVADHVGFVESVNSDGSINTIEGNSTNPSRGGRNGVFRHREYPGDILGYGYPAYSGQGNTTSPKTYKVKAGDTLWGIAAALGVSLTALLAANPGPASHPTLIHPGDTITVPQGGSTAPAPAPKPVTPTPVKPPVSTPPPAAKPPVVTPPKTTVPKPPAGSPTSVRALSYGMSGTDVSRIQECLHERGYNQPVTGWYGPITEGNVRYFLSLRSWLWTRSVGGPDGIAGPMTQHEICNF